MPSYKLIYHLDFYLSPSFDKEPVFITELKKDYKKHIKIVRKNKF